MYAAARQQTMTEHTALGHNGQQSKHSMLLAARIHKRKYSQSAELLCTQTGTAAALQRIGSDETKPRTAETDLYFVCLYMEYKSNFLITQQFHDLTHRTQTKNCNCHVLIFLCDNKM